MTAITTDQQTTAGLFSLRTYSLFNSPKGDFHTAILDSLGAKPLSTGSPKDLLPSKTPESISLPLFVIDDTKAPVPWLVAESGTLDGGDQIATKPIVGGQRLFHPHGSELLETPQNEDAISTENVMNEPSVVSPSTNEDVGKWQENEIPEELGYVDMEEPEDIRNVVQETLDEHRALRASKLYTQAIVVRTTITISTTSSRNSTCFPIVESCAMSPNQLSDQSLWDERSDCESPAPESVSSTELSVGEQELRDLRSPRDLLFPTSSNESLSSSTGSSHARSSRKRDRIAGNQGLFRLLPGLVGRRLKKPDSSARTSSRARSIECISCFDDIPEKKAVDAPCRHSYCRACFSQLVKTAMLSEDTFPPKCCLQDIPRRVMQLHLPPDELNQFDKKALEYAVPVGNRYYCGSPECAEWIDTRKAWRWNGGLECPHCEFKMCISCRGAQHGRNQDCPQDFGLRRALEQAERAGWRRCYSCRTMVELNTGCRHITCKCRAEFCYTCGARWRTCACTEVDQALREAEIADRLEAYNAEVHAEEADVNAAIAAVEAAERRVAQEREAEERAAEEERRIKEAEEATRIEYERVEGINDYFQQLREILGKIDVQQKHAIINRHEAVEQPSIARMKADLASADMYSRRVAQISSERDEIVASNDAKILEIRRRHRHSIRQTVHRHRNDQDTVFLQPIPGPERHRASLVDRTLTMLMAAQDAERNTLQGQQDRELRKWLARGAARLHEFDEIMQEERARFGKLHLTRTEEITRSLERAIVQCDADWKWFDMIVAERQGMLKEEENRMIMSGADAPWQDSTC